MTRGEGMHHVLLEPAHRLVGDADAVLLGGWESPAYWQISRAAARRGARRVGFYESTLASMGHRRGAIARARRSFFRSLDAVVVPGIAARDAIMSFGVPADRIHLGFNAVDMTGFAAVAEHDSPSDQSGHRYVYVGQLIHRKNVAALIQAFELVRTERDTLTIIGAGELQSTLSSLVERLGLGLCVEFRGPLAYADLPAALGEMHTLVLPSTEEVWGLVANEALAAGRHVVISEAAGAAASIRGMEGVVLCKPTATDIARGMRDSREQWQGPIQSPAILTHTPERLADVFVSALLPE